MPRRWAWTTSLVLGAAVVLAGCEAPPMPTIRAPWIATEPRDAEPEMRAPDMGPPRWERIGSSIRGKAIEALTIGDGPRKIYVIGGIHGDEPEGPLAAALLPQMLTELTEIRSATIRIVRDMNPDGTASRTRGNTRGADLNRNWPSPTFAADRRTSPRPKSELETGVVYEDMRRFNPDIVVVFHSSARGPEVTFEGQGLLPGREFVSAARRQDPRWRLVPETRYQTPGSLESMVGKEWRKPVLIVEFFRGRDAATNARSARDGLLATLSTSPAAPIAGSTRFSA
ncbi:succinylglutamate desuccinylase/aspartoacylase family protein [Leptolyngbya sp. 15MV]|nr:succinylglutamate desuccinylase/aspartoacylase family protein [Leptolyngbya sp. 15MV]